MAGKTQRRIQSIDVGFRLIRVLERAAGKLPLGVIAEQADMPSSKAHLYMVSFMDLGLVIQDPVTLRYGLGPYALQLGAAALRQIDIINAALVPMHTLQESAGLLVFLSVWGNRGPVIVTKIDGNSEGPISVRPGYVLPLYKSATGRVFLAFLPRSITDPVTKQEQVDEAFRRRIDEGLDKVKSDGLGFSDGQINAGYSSISAPIFDYTGQISAAITVLGVTSRLGENPKGQLSKLVSRAAEQISSSLGHLGQAPTPQATAEKANARNGPAKRRLE